MPQIPRNRSLDSTLAMLRDPYGFISKSCRHYQSDLFEARIMFQKTICMMGKETAGLFYDSNHFLRKGAAPGRIEKTLFGQGGVQEMDDEFHWHRKQMFMSLMSQERIRELTQMMDNEWCSYIRKWALMDKVVLYNELHELLCRTVCAWAGIPLPETEVSRRTHELTVLFDMAGAIGPKHWQARLARKRADRWIANLIETIRAGRIKPPEQSAAYIIAWHRDLNGDLLPPRIAAVELLNVLRPTMAVSVFITLSAVALHQYPACRRELMDGENSYLKMFVQEVRRFYPFFPAVGALVRHDFEWKGYFFPQGRRVLLDLYGTNHDPRIWEEPEEFIPERFHQWDGSPFNFIPQGGGDHSLNHRCPGEWITIELMKVALGFLAERMIYDVPEQDLAIDYSRLPALPQSRFIISNVKTKHRNAGA